jgi:hypothetical protein
MLQERPPPYKAVLAGSVLCGWVRQLFFDDPRYRVLRDISRHSGALDADKTDGAELTLYVWREFCESPVPPPISGPSVHEVVERLKVLMPARRAGRRSQPKD